MCGRLGRGAQRCQLQPNTYCEHAYTIQHEFTHALGVWHIQNRPDRDQYVTINWSNIPQSSYINFKLMPDLETYGIPYNGRSVMHYWWSSHALNPRVFTINSKVSQFELKLHNSSLEDHCISCLDG